MEQLTERLKEFWAKQSGLAKLLFIGLPLLLIGGAFAVVGLMAKPPEPLGLLYSELDPSDASAILEKLDAEGVDYNLQDSGTSILVPASQVDRVRIDLNRDQLPKGHVGLELFEKQKFARTETEMQVDRQRATQGELARTLEAMPAVKSAHVLLSIAEDDHFLEQNPQSKARVSLTLVEGQSLDKSQVRGIAHSISCAVQDLSPEDVSISDQFGHELNQQGLMAAEGGAALDDAASQLLLRRSVEKDFEDKIVRLLAPTYGRDGVSATVTVALDLREITKQRENYSPVVGDSGIERQVVEKRETSVAGTSSAQGAPGTPSNVAGYETQDGSNGASGGNSKYESAVDYEINKEVVDEVVPPGEIARRSATVAIDTDNFDEEIKANLESLVADAIGADLTRGDRISVQAMEFGSAAAADGAPAQQALAAQGQRRMVSTIAGWLVALISIVLVMVLLRGLVSQLFPRPAEELVSGFAGLNGVELDDSMLGADDGLVLQRLDKLGDNQTQKMKNEIERLIDTRPEIVASLVRNWLLED